MIERQRKIDINKMDIETADAVSKQLGDKVNTILKKAYKEANALLNIYGLKFEIGYDIQPISSDKEKE